MAKGRLIVIEGPDGSGKSTQVTRTAHALEEMGQTVHIIKFPDYAGESSALVKLYLNGDLGELREVNAYAASSFYAVDRYASYKQFWEKLYLRGDTILCDRYTTSNMIHQMTKLPKEEWGDFLRWLEDYEYHKLLLPKPSLVIYLDMHPDVSQTLLHSRYGGDDGKKDIHEADAQYLRSCRESAQYAAEHCHWEQIVCSDAAAPYEQQEITGQIMRIIHTTDQLCADKPVKYNR